jgi:hypothetical protein
MKRTLRRVPWFVSAPAVVVAAAGLAVVFNLLFANYFERTRADELDPFAAAPPPRSTATVDGTAPMSQPQSSPTAAAEPASAEPVVLYEGVWRDGEPGHSGEGTVRIGRDAAGKLVLRVEDFSVTNGPDLFVVLSPDENGYAAGSLNLGGLKATDGNFNYDIPGGTDLSRYRSAVIWCRSFDVTFAVAVLEPR